MDQGISGPQIRQSYFMGLYLAKYDKLKSNILFCPRLHRNWDPNTMEVGSNRICCFRLDVGVFSCDFESTTKLPSGMA